MLPMLLMIAAIGQFDAVSPPDPVGARQVRESVEKSLPFLAKKGVEWETTRCVSCHHGPWMMWSGYEARKRGFTVDEESLAEVRAGALQAYSAHPTLRPTSRDLLNDLSINSIYLIFGMGAAGEPDAETVKLFDKAVTHLLEQQKENGSWQVFMKHIDGKPVPSSTTSEKGVTTTFLMAPLIDTDDVTTMWALLALNDRQPAGVSKEVLDQSKARGMAFLKDIAPSDSLQSLTLRIMLDQRLGNADGVQAHMKQLLSLQSVDGGLSQTPKLKSDALGTGQALVALTTAGITAKDPAIERAWGWLVKNQKEDGSWFVVSRAYQAPEFSS